MVFDINAQMKLAQSLTRLTLKNMNAASETMINAQKPKTRQADNPPANIFDPNSWIEMMTATAGSPAKAFLPSLWWPLDPSFLSMNQPRTLGLPHLGLPNMAIPLGLNPFGEEQSDTGLQMPAFTTRSPLAGKNSPEWPNMFWWLVQKDDTGEDPSATGSDEVAEPWAMIMDPFGLLKSADQPTESVLDEEEADAEIEIKQETPNPLQMMFDPFRLLSEQPETPAQSRPREKRSKKSDEPAAISALDFFDPLGLMKTRSANGQVDRPDEKSRNLFFGFQPGARHPLMNAGRPTGMFYLAIALPEEIENINPHLPPWNLAF